MKMFVPVIALLAASANGARLPRDNYAQAASSRSAAAAAPVAIVRSINNAAGTEGFEDKFDFEFEAENGIKAATQGETRNVDGEDVMVMRGVYSYIDADGQEVTVSWYADETGYHAESDILPVAPAIPFEEQRIAVEAQIRFAEQERAAASRSSSSASSSYQEPAAASNSYQAAAPAPAPAPAPVVRQEPATTTYYVPAPAPAPAPAPVRVAQPSQIYYKPLEPAPVVVETRAEPVQTYYVPARAAAAPAALPTAESPEQPTYISYLYNN